MKYNKIYTGDCFDLFKDLQDHSVDLVITSPPYFNQRTYTESPKEIGKGDSIDVYISSLINVFKECLRVTKPSGSIVFNLGDKYDDGNLLLIPYRFAIEARKYAILINNVTWVKTNPQPRQFPKRMVSSTEPFFHFVKNNDYKYNVIQIQSDKIKPTKKLGQKYFELIKKSKMTDEQKTLAETELLKTIKEIHEGKYSGLRMKIEGLHARAFGGQEGGRLTQMLTKGYTIIKLKGQKIQKDVIESPVESIKWNKHPAIYPKAVVEKFIELTTNENDVVLDPFIGSGTTALASICKNRQYLGFELSPEFAEKAEERISDFKKAISEK